jgi:hypothetical protein
VRFLPCWSSILVLLCVPSVAHAQVGNIDEAWYKVITGIISIPAAILGLIVALNVIKKTTLESRKLELEIRQKQTEFSETRDVLPSAEQLARPVGESQRALLLVLRFVILQLAIMLWKVVPTAIGYLLNLSPMCYILCSALISLKNLIQCLQRRSLFSPFQHSWL